MSQTDKGVLMFSEWLEAMSQLNPKAYKEMMNAIYLYQIKGIEPPEFKGKAQMVAAIVFPYIRQRLEKARAGKKGMHLRYGVNPVIDEILRKREANANNTVNNSSIE